MTKTLVDEFKELKAQQYQPSTIKALLTNTIKRTLNPYSNFRLHQDWDARNWLYYKNTSRPRTRREGKRTAKLRAMANKYKAVQFTDIEHDAFKTIKRYLRHLYDEGEWALRKVEPALMFIQEQKTNNNWHMIRLPDRHPLANYAGSYTEEERVAYIEYRVRAQSVEDLHQLHVSEEVPTQVAYYPTLRAWRENRAVRTSFGKYLTKYKDLLCLTETQIKSMAEKYQSEINARAGWTLKYIEHNDPDGWLRIYNSDTVRSCMRGMDAVRVYAHEKSVLRLAYLDDGEGKVIARCIVRDDGETKGWLRVYPDHNGSSEGRHLLDSIKADGYVNNTNLDGVLLKAISTRDGGYVCPYIDSGDGGDQYADIVMRDGTEYLLLGQGDYETTSTEGYIAAGCSCDMCGDSVGHEDNLTWIDADEHNVCEYCRDNHYVYAYGLRYEAYYPTDDCIEVGGNWYVEEYAHNHDIYQCSVTDEWGHMDDMYCFEEGWVCSDVAVSVDHPHDGDTVVHPEYVHTLSDGTTCHDNDASYYEEEIQSQLEEGALA